MNNVLRFLKPWQLPYRLAVLLGLLLMLGAGLIHGNLTERWTPSADLEKAIKRIDNVAFQIGDWQGEISEADAQAFQQAGARGYSVRVYTNQRTQAKVLMILMCGRPGKMSVHTPEVCYRGAGYEMRSDASRAPVPDAPNNAFWYARFAKPTGLTSDLRLYWSWATNSTWEASDNPRWRYRGEPYLYKLYISYDHSVAHADAGDSALEFLKVLTPELKRTLFSAQAGSVN